MHETMKYFLFTENVWSAALARQGTESAICEALGSPYRHCTSTAADVYPPVFAAPASMSLKQLMFLWNLSTRLFYVDLSKWLALKVPAPLNKYRDEAQENSESYGKTQLFQ